MCYRRSSDTLPARPALSPGGAIQGLGAPEPWCSFAKVEKWNESQQQHFIVLQYITQSPEI